MLSAVQSVQIRVPAWQLQAEDVTQSVPGHRQHTRIGGTTSPHLARQSDPHTPYEMLLGMSHSTACLPAFCPTGLADFETPYLDVKSDA